MKFKRHNTGSLLNKTDELADLSWIPVLNIIGANELRRHDDSRDYEILLHFRLKTALNVFRFSTCQEIVKCLKAL